MKYALAMLVLLAWYCAVAFAAWLLYRNGHPAWAATVALLGAACSSVSDALK